MEQVDIFAHRALGGRLRNVQADDYLEDVSLRRLVLEQYDQEHVAIRRYVSFLGIDSETARELVQESFLKLHEHLLGGGDRTNLRAWLYRVAHNLARNAQTAFRASKTESLPEAVAIGLRADTISAEEEVLVTERNRLLREAMDGLTPAQKECLVLRTQGLKYREIGGILNLSVSTVAENVQRGLEKLKELI
jgi:RNA polymerase sigma-70 factor, ECF subfamily